VRRVETAPEEADAHDSIVAGLSAGIEICKRIKYSSWRVDRLISEPAVQHPALHARVQSRKNWRDGKILI
jgi:hypothetical protein